eukprot:gene5415-biopygen8742
MCFAKKTRKRKNMLMRTRTGRGPDAGRTIDFEETDADRTRAWPFLPDGGQRRGNACSLYMEGNNVAPPGILENAETAGIPAFRRRCGTWREVEEKWRDSGGEMTGNNGNRATRGGIEGNDGTECYRIIDYAAPQPQLDGLQGPQVPQVAHWGDCVFLLGTELVNFGRDMR